MKLFLKYLLNGGPKFEDFKVAINCHLIDDLHEQLN